MSNLESVTINVVDDLAAPLPGVNVQVYANQYTVVAAGITNALGNVSFQVVPRTYDVEFSRLKTQFSPLTMVVADTGGMIPQTFSEVGRVFAIVDVQPLTRVRLFGYLMGADGLGVADVRVVVETVAYGLYTPFVKPDPDGTGIDPIDTMVRPEKREIRTNDSGYWEADVVADSRVRVEIPDVRFYKVFRVPNDSRFPTLNIRDARPDPGPGADINIDTDVPQRDLLKGVG